MDVVVTGHRPQNLPGGFKNKKLHREIQDVTRTRLVAWKPNIVYTGMALGFDQWVADICIDEKIPFIAALPCQGQDRHWPTKSQQHYKWLLSHAANVVQVDRIPGYISNRTPPDVYHSFKMITRNMWMVDQLTDKADRLLCLWNKEPKSGYW